MNGRKCISITWEMHQNLALVMCTCGIRVDHHAKQWIYTESCCEQLHTRANLRMSEFMKMEKNGVAIVKKKTSGKVSLEKYVLLYLIFPEHIIPEFIILSSQNRFRFSSPPIILCNFTAWMVHNHLNVYYILKLW